MAKQFRERARVLINCNAPPSYSGRFGFIESKDGQFSWKVRLDGSDRALLFHEDEIDEVVNARPSEDGDGGCCTGRLVEDFRLSECVPIGDVVSAPNGPDQLRLRFHQDGERVVRLPGIEPVPDPYRAHVGHDRDIAGHMKGLLDGSFAWRPAGPLVKPEYAPRSAAVHPAALNFGVDIGRPGGDQSAASFFGSAVEVEAIQAVLERYVRQHQGAQVVSRLGVLMRLSQVICDLTSEAAGAICRGEPEPGPESGKTG